MGLSLCSRLSPIEGTAGLWADAAIREKEREGGREGQRGRVWEFGSLGVWFWFWFKEAGVGLGAGCCKGWAWAMASSSKVALASVVAEFSERSNGCGSSAVLERDL